MRYIFQGPELDSALALSKSRRSKPLPSGGESYGSLTVTGRIAYGIYDRGCKHGDLFCECVCSLCGTCRMVQPKVLPSIPSVCKCHSLTMEARFWKYVRKTSQCWLWVGKSRTSYGYGVLGNTGSGTGNKLAHVVSWKIHNGDVPPGLKVLHNCPGGDNPACVNPNHLWLGTSKDNTLDMMRKGRGLAVIPDAEVRYIRSQFDLGRTSSSIAIDLDIPRYTVLNVATRKSYTWVK